MPKFGDVIFSLAGKAGINKEDATLKQLLALPEIVNFNLPDELANALEKNLLTAESATAHPDVRPKLMAEALNGVDAKLDTLLADFEFDDTFKGEVKGIKNTYEKISKVSAGLKDKLKAAAEKAGKSGNSQDKAEVEVLKREVEAANTKMSNMTSMFEAEKQNLISANLNDKKQYILKSTLAARPLPKNGLPQEVNILTAQTLLQQDMAKHGLQILFDEAGNAVLKQRKDGADIDFFVDNKKVGYTDYVDGVLASNKFLQINDQSSQTSQGGPGNTGSQQSNNNNPVNQSILAESKAKMAELGMAV